MSLTERTQLDTTEDNCISGSKIQPDWIMYKKVTQAIGCNLPWIPYKYALENCQTEDDFNAYFNATMHLQTEIKNIPKPCKQNIWTVTNFFDDRDWTYPNTEYNVMFLGQDLRVTIEEQDYIYAFKDFIGDFGGYLGLFLGGSFIGVFEWLEKVSENLRKRFLK